MKEAITISKKSEAPERKLTRALPKIACIVPNMSNNIPSTKAIHPVNLNAFISYSFSDTSEHKEYQIL
jgi:hypothetical protein